MKPATHPATCRVCGGTGWQTGPPIPGHSMGKAFEYTTVEPCTYEEWKSQDDPTVDEYGYDTTTPITLDQYLAKVVAREDWAELDRWHRWLDRSR